MRLIDADRTKGVMERTLDDLKLFFLSREQRAHLISAFHTVKLIIDNAPTIDAVPVVRCKDCLVKQICRYRTGLGDNGFCSQGERID